MSLENIKITISGMEVKLDESDCDIEISSGQPPVTWIYIDKVVLNGKNIKTGNNKYIGFKDGVQVVEFELKLGSESDKYCQDRLNNVK